MASDLLALASSPGSPPTRSPRPTGAPPLLLLRDGGGRPRGHTGSTSDPALDALVDCARGGDADAFQDVAVRFAPPLVRYVMRFTGRDTEFANDVVQDALVAAWCNLDSIRDAGHLRPWLFRVARFKAVDQLRRRGPRGIPMQSLDIGREMDREPTASPSTDPATSRAVAQRGARHALHRVLASLPERYIGAVRLHYLHGLPLSETSRLLGLPRSTVKMRLHRARRTLRRLLRNEPGLDAYITTHREGAADGTHDT